MLIQFGNMVVEWDEEKYGLLPTSMDKNGSYQGRETVIGGMYSCGAPIVVYADTLEVCEEQNEALHELFHVLQDLARIQELIDEVGQTKDDSNPFADNDLPDWTNGSFDIQ